jgi:hypothetical protein
MGSTPVVTGPGAGLAQAASARSGQSVADAVPGVGDEFGAQAAISLTGNGMGSDW